ncbi:beta-carboxysome assembly chaperone CcmS [Pannus brasiliensis]
MKFGQSIPDDQANLWRYQVDRFVEDNREKLAGLLWGLLQEWGEDSKDILGIDLKPSPHFIRCSREALEKLNRRVDRQIQEILGIVDRYSREDEVAIVAIGHGQVKLIYYKPDRSPRDCFEDLSIDLDTLIQQLETEMVSEIDPLPA